MKPDRVAAHFIKNGVSACPLRLAGQEWSAYQANRSQAGDRGAGPQRPRRVLAGPDAVAVWIGTSGWSYDHWHPELYPPGLPARDRLARYAQAFTTAALHSRS